MPCELCRTEARQLALADVVATLRTEYGAAVSELRARLLAAKEASDAVRRLRTLALQEVPDRFDAHYHAGVTDAGEAGLVTAAAGLPDLALNLLSGPSGTTVPLDGTRLGGWLRQADALLAQLPRMAEEDQARRAAHDNALARQAAEDRRKQALWAEHLAKSMTWVRLAQPAVGPARADASDGGLSQP